jgi:glycine/D-amino acid oxidase-like deaminating enzyme
MKVGIVGSGLVGSTAAYAAEERGPFERDGRRTGVLKSGLHRFTEYFGP